MTTDKPYYYEIKIEGCLTERWSEWFEGLEIRNDPEGLTTIRGMIADQAALFGLLGKIQALNLELVSVRREKRRKG